MKDLIEAKITIVKWMRAWKGEMTAMGTCEGNDKNISIGTDAYYEEQACQEEIYLEEIEEDLRMILESDDPSPLRSESPDQQRGHAAEDLIIGDSDDQEGTFLRDKSRDVRMERLRIEQSLNRRRG